MEIKKIYNGNCVDLAKHLPDDSIVGLNKYFISDKESGQTLAIVEAENKIEATKIAEKEYDIESIIIDKA